MVKSTNRVAAGEGNWTFTLVAQGDIEAGDTITLMFPEGFTLSGARNAEDWVVDDLDVITVAGEDEDIIITVPTGVSISDGDSFDVLFDPVAARVLGNPDANAIGADVKVREYRISAESNASSDSTKVQSAPVTISKTTISPDFMVELSDDATGAMSDWTITLPINGPFATETVTLTFPTELMVDDATKVENERQWMMNDVVASASAYTAEVTTPGDEVGFIVVLTPRTRGFDALEADDELVITYTGNGIVNPSMEATDLKVAAFADNQEPVDSAAFDITVPNTPTDVSVANSPDDPGAAAQYTVMFKTLSELRAGVATITFDIDSSVGVPSSLSRDHIRISADMVTGDDASTIELDESRPDQSIAPSLDPRRRDGSEGRDIYTITVPDMDARESSGIENIEAGAMVTVTFLSSAGLTNPTEQNLVKMENGERISGGDDFKVSTSKQMDGKSAYFSTPLKLVLNDLKDNRNTPITLTGSGFKDGTGAIIYLDYDGDGEKNGRDVALLSEAVTVSSNDTFTVTLNVTVPPFKVGMANQINVMDGESPPNHYNGMGDQDAITFTIEPLLAVSPRSAAVGDEVQLTLTDWLDQEVKDMMSVTIGGEPQKVISGTGNVGSDNSHVLRIKVGNSVPSGVQQLRVRTFKSDDSNGATDTKNITIASADLSATPTTAVPNQAIIVNGRGFTAGESINGGTAAAPDDSSVMIGQDGTHLMRGDINFNNGQEVDVDSSGNWSATIIVPMNDATTTAGSHPLTVIDSMNRSGTVYITIPERTLNIEPAAARPGDTVTLTGTGFPATSNRSPEQPTPVVDIEYGDRRVATTTPDSDGNINVMFDVPLSVDPSTTSRVEAKYEWGSPATEVVAFITHEVPGAQVELSKSEGSPGDRLTITGSGFRSFLSVDEVEIGGIDVTPAPKPATNRNGSFTAVILVPDLAEGTNSVKVVISGITATANFKILEEGDGTMMPEVMMAEAATPDVAFAAVIAEDNLIAVYHFDPATQNEAPNYGYTVYDARPLFMSGNNLDSIEPGQFYTVQVSEDQMGVTLGSQTVDLYAPFTPIRW